MPDSELCHYLGWDSEFFGRRIARIGSDKLDADRVQAIVAWSKSENIDCLYFLAGADDSETVRCAEKSGFQLVDIRITLERSVDGPPLAAGDTAIRPARDSDIPKLKSIARENHRDSRFYHDGHFAESSCDALFETWIEKSCQSYAEVVLVPEFEGSAAGYISCHLPDAHTGQIGLLGVAPEAQGRRVGRELVEEAMRWFSRKGRDRVVVVTQGRNFRAQRLYQRCGFVTQSLQLWYHKWLKDSELRMNRPQEGRSWQNS